ncbi:MAG: tRNA 5-methoxyuridine(34)/uridine 5-oxyacetic acid(34) synthase CmoB [Gammaproteobacteria bacterium]|nr:tRNA 5-methoxyuridine(34)/uridine 5-oxyacetic acid(34) synthase CmoB [Gammaproteobacteria bacterium]
MIDYAALAQCWRDLNLEHWWEPVEALSRARLTTAHHGDYEKWRSVIEALPRVADDPAALKEELLKLAPWRKGPFELGGVTIDSEWRSNLKWDRIAGALALEGCNVLDVGSGNGYYALRMRQAGANTVIGIDPTLLYVMQFLAVNHFVGDTQTFILPLRLHELPDRGHRFDVAFSMGVLYHQRAPIDHLRQLRDTLRPQGQLLLETLYLPGEEAYASTPTDRYARMKNVWLLPTIAELMTWLARSGYRDIELVDQSVTNTDEQRSTAWMSFESLADALDPGNPDRTVEDWPAPRRVIVSATSP